MDPKIKYGGGDEKDAKDDKDAKVEEAPIVEYPKWVDGVLCETAEQEAAVKKGAAKAAAGEKVAEKK